MPLFVIIANDVANSHEQRQKTRPEHVARLQALIDENRLVLAGPTPVAHGETAMGGSLIVAEFEDLASVQAWVDDEPYLRDGVYSHVEVRPFVKVLP